MAQECTGFLFHLGLFAVQVESDIKDTFKQTDGTLSNVSPPCYADKHHD